MLPLSSHTKKPEVLGWELLSLAAVSCFILFAMLFDENGSTLEANLVAPIWLSLSLLTGAVSAIRREPLSIWTGLVWLRVSSAVYFGLGTLAHRAMNETTLAALDDFHFASESEILRFNLLTALCCLTILTTTAAASSLWPCRPTQLRQGDDRLMLACGLLFGLPGFAVKYLIIFPHSMGAFGEGVVLPGLLTQLVWLAPVATFLVTGWTIRHCPAWVAPLVVLTLLDASFGLLRFSKAEALLPLLMLALAFLHHRLTLKRAALMAFAFALVFPPLQTLTAAGRAELTDRYETIRSASFTERLGILQNALTGETSADPTEFQGALMRIAYVHAAAPAIALYDGGDPGSSLAYVPLVPIPRMIWQDKPVFDMGTRYTQLLTGSETSSTWMGYFGEAYWNLGWLGVPIVMIPLGLILFVTGRYSVWVLRNGEWLHFPAVFLGLYMGARADGVIAGDIAGSTFTILLVYPVALLATPVLRDLIAAPAVSQPISGTRQ